MLEYNYYYLRVQIKSKPKDWTPFNNAKNTRTQAAIKQIVKWGFKPPKLSMPSDISSTLSLLN